MITDSELGFLDSHAMRSSLLRLLYHAVLWPQFRTDRELGRFARSIPTGSQILEFGSGPPDERGNFPHSAVRFLRGFEFRTSDVNPDYGHEILDITDHHIVTDHDVVIASSVLEHVFNLAAAIRGLFQAVRPGGLIRVTVPFTYPLHDEPDDFWRITEHGFARLFGDSSRVDIRPHDPRRLPSMYTVVAIR